MSEDGNLEATNLMALHDLKDEREGESLLRLNEINRVERVDEDLVSEIKELQIVTEPSLVEIKELDRKIQDGMRRLKLRAAWVDEIKRSRLYVAKVQVGDKAIALEAKETKKDRVAGLGGSTGTQTGLGRPNLSPGFLFSNFPGSDLLGDVAGENYSGQDYGERAHTGQQGFFGQPEIIWQPKRFGQFGISGQPELLGQPECIGQFGIGGQSRIVGQSRNIGSTEIPGQLENIGRPRVVGELRNTVSADVTGQFGNIGQARCSPFGGNMGSLLGNEVNASRNENVFRGDSVVKFPKLELKRFSGDPMKWLEFWDNFQRNVHDNQGYSDVHKMSYLKACLDGAASTTIANLCIKGDNYKPALETLKGKYGQTGLLKGAHMAALKATQGVTNPRDLHKLRSLYDEVDSHYKALSVLGVPGEHYSVAILPELMRKLPRDIAINIRRSKEVNHEWKIGEFLEQFWQELVLRSADESHEEPTVGRKREGRVLAVNSTACVYCLGEHASSECSQIEDIDKRKGILRKYNRCF